MKYDRHSLIGRRESADTSEYDKTNFLWLERIKQSKYQKFDVQCWTQLFQRVGDLR